MGTRAPPDAMLDALLLHPTLWLEANRDNVFLYENYIEDGCMLQPQMKEEPSHYHPSSL
jgi:hypothetical protein